MANRCCIFHVKIPEVGTQKTAKRHLSLSAPCNFHLFIRKLARTTLSDVDFDFHEAENGIDALRIATNLRSSIVLLDVMMPGGLDGLQVCASIKNGPEICKLTKVVLLSVRSDEADVNVGKVAGCDAYLVKPFSPLELLETVDRLKGQM